MNNAHALERGLLEEITAHENLKRAWQRVKGNKGAAGCDEVSVPDFPAWAREHWPILKAELVTRHVLTQRGTPSIDPQSAWR